MVGDKSLRDDVKVGSKEKGELVGGGGVIEREREKERERERSVGRCGGKLERERKREREREWVGDELTADVRKQVEITAPFACEQRFQSW